jgi:hypothetical protein
MFSIIFTANELIESKQFAKLCFINYFIKILFLICSHFIVVESRLMVANSGLHHDWNAVYQKSVRCPVGVQRWTVLLQQQICSYHKWQIKFDKINGKF